MTKQLLWNTNGTLPLRFRDGDDTYIYGPTSTPIAQIDVNEVSHQDGEGIEVGRAWSRMALKTA